MVWFRRLVGVWVLVLAAGPLGAQMDEDPAAYILEGIDGEGVQVRVEGAPDWAAAQEGQVLERGDSIRVGKGAQATLMMRSDASIHLEEGSVLEVAEAAENGTGGFLSRLKLTAGRLLADVRRNLGRSRSTFEIEAGGVVLGVRGTAFEVSLDGEDLRAAVHEGEVEVTGPEGSRRVGAGRLLSLKARHFLLLRALDRSEKRRFLEWREIRRAVLRKRLQRLEDIRNKIRKPWVRRQPRLRGSEPGRPSRRDR